MYAVLMILIATSWTFFGAHVAGIEENREPENPPLRPLIVKVNADGEFVDFSVNFKDVKTDEKTVQFSTNFKYYCPYSQESYNLTEVEDGKNCSLEVQPIILPSGTENVPCGPLVSEEDRAGVLFEFVYMLEKNTAEYEYSVVYKFCYNYETKNVIYTWHKLQSPTLFEKYDASGKLANYYSHTKTTDSYGIHLLGDRFQKKAEYYKTLIDEENPTDFMVPPEDMVFSNWQKTVYHYANVKPSSKPIIEMWTYVNDKIRKKAINTNAEFEIFTRVTDIEVSGGTETIWRKMVYDRRSEAGVMIIINEKVSSNNSPDLEKNKRLVQVEKFVENLCNKNQVKPCFTSEECITCCEVDQKQLNLFGENFEVKDYLDIEDTAG